MRENLKEIEGMESTFMQILFLVACAKISQQSVAKFRSYEENKRCIGNRQDIQQHIEFSSTFLQHPPVVSCKETELDYTNRLQMYRVFPFSPKSIN